MKRVAVIMLILLTGCGVKEAPHRPEQTVEETQIINNGVEIAKEEAGRLMPGMTYGFGEGIKAFFGALDDAIVYLWK